MKNNLYDDFIPVEIDLSPQSNLKHQIDLISLEIHQEGTN